MRTRVSVSDKILVLRGNEVARVETHDFESLATRQRWQAVAYTQRDVWLTAAIVSLFIGPLGILFGVAALIAMRGTASTIRIEQVELTEQRLRHARRLVWLGVAFTGLLMLVSLVATAGTVRDMAALAKLHSSQRSSYAP